MKINLKIDEKGDAQLIASLLSFGFGDEKAFTFAFETKSGGTFSMKSSESAKVIREQYIKPFFESILKERGDNACFAELQDIMDEIERGE